MVKEGFADKGKKKNIYLYFIDEPFVLDSEKKSLTI